MPYIDVKVTIYFIFLKEILKTTLIGYCTCICQAK